MAQFGNTLLYLRKREKLTQQELADKLTSIGEAKITRSAVGMWESGKRIPKLEVLKTIADFFNINMDSLTGGIENLKTSAHTLSRSKQSASTAILTEDEQELVSKYQQLTELNKGRVLQQIDTLLDDQKQGAVKSIDSVG